MNQAEAIALLEKLRELCPMPWYLERDNEEGVQVNDCTGETVYVEWYHQEDSPPDMRAKCSALARFLVSISQT